MPDFPVTFHAGDLTPSWLLTVRPEGCFARFLQAVEVTGSDAEDHEHVLRQVDPRGGTFLLEVVSDGRPADLVASGRGAKVEGVVQLTSDRASHYNRKTRRRMLAAGGHVGRI